jgi:hypothetical protein
MTAQERAAHLDEEAGVVTRRSGVVIGIVITALMLHAGAGRDHKRLVQLNVVSPATSRRPKRTR